jgi:hypothetical protein
LPLSLPRVLPDLTVYMGNTWVYYKKQNMITLHEHLSFTPRFGGFRDAHLFSILCHIYIEPVRFDFNYYLPDIEPVRYDISYYLPDIEPVRYDISYYLPDIEPVSYDFSYYIPDIEPVRYDISY